MEADEQISKFKEFIETNYYSKLLENIRKENNFLIIDFNDLSKFNPDLANILLEQPEEVIKAAEVAIEQFDLEVRKLRIRFNNLPESQKVKIRDIRSKHIDRLLHIEGIVRQKSDVRPQVTSARFECPSCGNVINVLQLDSAFKEPTRCGCGRKGKFTLLAKELVDAQGLVLEEASENLEGGEQPKRMNVLLKDDLVSPMSEKKTNPGSKVVLVGQVKEVPIILRSGGKSTRFDLVIEANNVEATDEMFYEVNLTEEEEKQIKELAQDPQVYEKLINSMAPSIYGYEKIKEALLLQSVGGIQKIRKDGVVSRGDMHILLIGDPGAGKCSSADTKIILEDGEITSIESFYEKNISFNNPRNAMKIFSINQDGLNFASQPTRFWRREAPENMLRITTCTGNILTVTNEHPLFTTYNGLIFSKMASEFKAGDYIATPSKIDIKASLQFISKDAIPSKSRNKVKYSIKGLFDEEFARLWGYLVGDGNVELSKIKGVIRFTNSNIELLNDFENLVKRVFDCKVTKTRKKNTTCWDYRCLSIELARILNKIDCCITKKSESTRICPLVCKSPNYVLKEFIKALFDCEGYVKKNRREIELNSKSKELIYDLKSLLLRFGISSQVSSSLKCATNTLNKIKRTYYRLRISGQNVIRYYDEIGFLTIKKKGQLRDLIESKKKLNTNLNIVPGLKEILKVLREKYSISQFSFPIKRSTYQHYEKGDRFPSYEKLRQICKAYNGLKVYDPLIDILNKIAYAHVFWDKIKCIEVVKSCDEYVYDLEIDNVHNFVANGVVIHNSALLKRISRIAPKGRYVSGKGVSGAGLTAAVVRDEFLKGWSLEAGAMVLSSNGVCCIDEIDKISNEDRAAMHEALENQTVSISKANIQATLIARTTVLGAANPKFGRFDPSEIVADQIDLPPTLINRFDLIFPIKDLPDSIKDERMASHILDLHQKPEMQESELSTEFLRKYIMYVRQKIKPKLTEGVIEELKKYYVEMRNKGNLEEGGLRTIPISPRQLEALIRLSEASAKIKLAEEVTIKDARRAVELLEYCLMQVGFDKETGKIDIDRIVTGIPTSQRSHIHNVKEIIAELEKKIGKTIPIDDIIAEAREKGIEADKVDEVLERLKRTGDVFEPKRGFIQKI